MTHRPRSIRSRARGAWLATALALLTPAMAAAQPTWTITEEVRIGSGESEATTFTDIRGLAVGADGRVLVLDYRTQEIRLFDAAGRFVKIAARRGSGPGEIRNANGMVQAPDGTIWVNDPANARFTLFRPDGSFLRQYTLPILSYGFLWDAMIDARGRVYDPIIVPDAKDGRTRRVRRIAPDGAVRDTIGALLCPSERPAPRGFWRGENKSGASTSMAVPFLPRQQTAWDPRGFAWCTPSDAYRVVKIGLERSDTVAVAARDVAAPPVTAAERQAAIRRADSVLKRYEKVDADYSLIPKVKPAIEALDLDDAGHLWVRRTTTDSASTTFDVFDPRGRLVATARAPFRISPYWHPVLVRGDVMYTVMRDEDEIQYVVRARIRR